MKINWIHITQERMLCLYVVHAILLTESILTLPLLLLLFQVFRGNFDRHTVVAYRFVPPFKAQFVRIHPRSWRGHVSMRAEFYGCLAGM